MHHFCSPAGVSEVILAISEATPSVAGCAPLEGCLGIPKHREVESTLLTQQALYWRTTGWGEGGCSDVISLQKESEMEISSLSFSKSIFFNGTTFPHELTTFQWSKVVSDTIFPTN